VSTRSIFISAGEASGDRYLAKVVQRLLKDDPSLHLFGIGGDGCEAAGVKLIAHARQLAITGISEVLKKIPFFLAVRQQCRQAIDRWKPCCAILVDFPDFNLRLAKDLHARQVPILYYILPQLWAWRPGRLRVIQRTVSRGVVIFPFEPDWYREHGFHVDYLGHPLLDEIPAAVSAIDARRRLGLDPERMTLVVMPGSRQNELNRLLPPVRATLERVTERLPMLQTVVPIASTVDGEPIRAALRGFANLSFVSGSEIFLALQAADVGLIKSGTSVLEACMARLPMVVIYKVSRTTELLVRLLLNRSVRHFSIVNVLSREGVVPELSQRHVNPTRITAALIELLESSEKREQMKNRLTTVARSLGASGAGDRVAKVAQSLMGENRRVGGV